MGLFDRVFKPSPEELKDAEDAKRSRDLIANYKWDQVVEIGKPAVKPLISFLNNNSEADFVASVAETLGKIGDVSAIESLCSCLWKTDDALRTNDQRHHRVNWVWYEHVMPAIAKAFASMGEPAVDQLTKRLGNDTLLFGIPKVWAICAIGDRKTTETILNWIFKVGPVAPRVIASLEPLVYQGKFLSPPDLIRSILPPNVLPKLLGDYTNLVLDIFAWQPASHSDATGRLQFNLSRCSEAIQRICEIKTHISSNILHKISKIDKVHIVQEHTGVQSLDHYLDFKEYRQVSKDELKRRGNPNYDSSVFLDEKAWELK